ncbi:MAG: hypothetical protein IJV36_03155 [Prevotella sp.]|nr:hypothetical protein [Prevotella sp.]
MNTLFLLLAFPVVATAQKEQRPKFDPVKFEAELEQFITTEAGLSPQEAAQFFPVYREMQKKQRVIFDEMRRFRHMDINDNQACEDAIEKQDKMDIQIKEIQQQYHVKFMKVLPAGKVFKILRAEEKFHRQAFKRVAKPDDKKH